jgi:hypothetical protein
VNERELTVKILAYAAPMFPGLLIHHCPDSRRCEGGRGMPDLVILSPKGILLAELKSDDGETSAEQDLWLYTLWLAGLPWAIWRPRDWNAGKIQKRLDELAMP